MSDEARVCPEVGLKFPLPRDPACPWDPAPEYREIQATCPVAKAELRPGLETWLVSRYEDVKRVLSDVRFSSDVTRPGFPTVTESMVTLTRRFFTMMDPPEHTSIRRR